MIESKEGAKPANTAQKANHVRRVIGQQATRMNKMGEIKPHKSTFKECSVNASPSREMETRKTPGSLVREVLTPDRAF